jgi:hypothetical protein
MAPERPPRTRDGVLVGEVRRRGLRYAASLVVLVVGASEPGLASQADLTEWRRDELAG